MAPICSIAPSTHSITNIVHDSVLIQRKSYELFCSFENLVFPAHYFFGQPYVPERWRVDVVHRASV